MDREPTLPIAISYIGSKYLIFDIDVVTWLRRVYHICGVMTGTLPQAPSQNIFLGLPVHIMPEEAQLLVEKGVAYIMDDAQVHAHALQSADASRHAAYMSDIRNKGQQVSIARHEEKEQAKRQSLKQSKTKSKPKSKHQPSQPSTDSTRGFTDSPTAVSPPPVENDSTNDSFFNSPAPTTAQDESTPDMAELQPHNIVPTTSDLWLPRGPSPPPPSDPAGASRALLPDVPPSYALYRHLNAKSYFMTPGLRFGCQYCVYPGDPLRFHSHFLATGVRWDEEIDLMHLVSGGRLGTGVKKGFLIGGEDPTSSQEDGHNGKKRVRTFSIEWAAM